MAGHSKWANIKRRKERQDAKKTRTYSKILREIAVATQVGGQEIASNPRLRIAIQNARVANVPKDNVMRAMKKVADPKTKNYKEVRYEGYGRGGVAILVIGLTDNVNRTVADVRFIFNKYQGSLGKQGSMAHLFRHQGFFRVGKEGLSENFEDVSLGWIEAGAEDITRSDNHIGIMTAFEDFSRMQKKLEEDGVDIQGASIVYIPRELAHPSGSNRVMNEKLVYALEENEDVQRVYHNMSASFTD